MTIKKNDLRSEVTKRLIREAFLELLLEKSFEEITIIDLCQHAHIHRTTFYKYYDDKYQLLDSMLRIMRTEISNKQGHTLQVYETPNDYFLKSFQYSLEFLKANNLLFSSILFQKGNEYVELALKNLITDYLREEITAAAAQGGIHFKVAISLVAEYYSAAALAAVTWWFKNRLSCSVQEMVDNLRLLITDEFVDKPRER